MSVPQTTTYKDIHTPDDVIDIGRFDEILLSLANYTSHIDKNLAAQLASSHLFAPTCSPTIYQAITGLAGNVLSGAPSVTDNGLQIGNPANLTARAEVTRWFATVMLYVLYSAQMDTSGVDNNWGEGYNLLLEKFHNIGFVRVHYVLLRIIRRLI